MSFNKSEKLFNEFEGISKNSWLNQAIKDLNDPDEYQWATDEGLQIDPFYTREDLQSSIMPSVSNTSTSYWKYFENIKVINEKEANNHSLNALNNGADGIIFKIEDDELPDFKQLLKDIFLQYCYLSFDAKENTPELLKLYFKYIIENKITDQKIKGALQWDPMSEWTLSEVKSNPSFKNLEKVLKNSEISTDFRCFSISSEVYKNSGATAIQEISLVISSLIEYVKVLSKTGIAPELVFRKSWFIISIGKNYFFEIAKIRALKLLVLQIAKIYKIKNFNEDDLNIHVTTSWWTKTAKDPYSNILRNTTEAMAGILGGCTSVSILPHDIVTSNNNEFSRRISRNISNILKEEVYLHKVSNPVDGSYYIESLTNQMLKKIWDQVQIIEEQGGFVEAFKKGIVKDMVAPKYKKAVDSIVKVEDKVIGSNYYTNQYDIDIKLSNKRLSKGWFDTDRLTEVLERKTIQP